MIQQELKSSNLDSFIRTVEQNSDAVSELREKYGYDEKRFKRIKKKIVDKRPMYVPGDWDIDYYTDIITGQGFNITSAPDTIMDAEDGGMQNINGPLSPKYGAIYTNTDSYILKYQCNCGGMYGHANLGRICPICDSEVTSRDPDPKKTGWITLPNNNFLINPYFYPIFGSVFGGRGAVFEQIITKSWYVDVDGIEHFVQGDDANIDGTMEVLSPYSGCGIDGFRYQFDEIMDYYIHKFKNIKNKVTKLKWLKSNKKSIFISHIPVYTPMFRPQSLMSGTFWHCEIDRSIINPCISSSRLLQNASSIARPRIIQDMQARVNKLVEKCISDLDGKKGWIQGNIFAGRNNYISRDVIIPDITLQDDEVDLCYITFLRMYQTPIIEHLKRMLGLDHQEAKSEVFMAEFVFSNLVYSVMEFMVREEGQYVMIDRNPTLWKKSVNRMKIRRVIPDIEKYCLVLPYSITVGMNADFDGDIINNQAMLIPEIAYIYRKFDPTVSYIIDPVTGTIDPAYLPKKDVLADLINFVCL